MNSISRSQQETLFQASSSAAQMRSVSAMTLVSGSTVRYQAQNLSRLNHRTVPHGIPLRWTITQTWAVYIKGDSLLEKITVSNFLFFFSYSQKAHHKFLFLPSFMVNMAANRVLVGVVLAITCLAASVLASRTEGEMFALFEEWLQNNPRPYSNDVDERNLRYEIFKSNLNIIDEHNAMQSSYTLGLNGFSDLTLEEFKDKYLGKRASSDVESTPETTPFRYANVTPPAAIDWRKKGAVTPIKDQGQCGSCWAFSTVGAVEGIVQIETGKLISLSEQELISCDLSSDNQGCNGGLMYPSFGWIMTNGIASEAAYPYTGQDDPCAKKKLSVASITGRENVPANSEKALQQVVSKQPVAVAIDGGSSLFQSYVSGILQGDCGTTLDHAVVAIGYGTTSSGEDYWILKNSWGVSWGENGFVRFKRNVPPNGICGIAMEASYPTKQC